MEKMWITNSPSPEVVAKVLPTSVRFHLAVIGLLLEMRMEVLKAKLASESEKVKHILDTK